jgi:hypothetical protein
MRGRDWRDNTGAGVFAVQGDIAVIDNSLFIGFRCAR